MKRRNFIKNTGLSIAGLAFSNSIYSKNSSEKKSLDIIILMSGGVKYDDLINHNSNKIPFLFQDKSPIFLNCKSNIRYSGKTLEHAPALLEAMHGIQRRSGRKIFISNKNTDTTQAILDAKLDLEMVSTNHSGSLFPYRNDAAVFEMAKKYISSSGLSTLVLNLEDTDIAHCNANHYQEVLNFYRQQINDLCQIIYASQFREFCEAKLMVAALIGRNNFENDVMSFENNAGSDHYDESARMVCSFSTSFAETFQLIYDHQQYNSNDFWNNTELV